MSLYSKSTGAHMMVLEAHVLTERIGPVTPGAPKKGLR